VSDDEWPSEDSSLGTTAPVLSATALQITDPTERIRAFESAWEKLSDAQKVWLTAFRQTNFHKRKALGLLGDRAPDQSTIFRWRSNEHFAFLEKALKADLVKDVLERDRLVIRTDNIVEDALERKPILYMGQPTGFFENDPGTALKGNEQLLKLGGHLKEDVQQGGFTLPQLVIAVTAKTGEVTQQIQVGVIPPQPALEVDEWPSTP
jgi:hypothetical protein